MKTLEECITLKEVDDWLWAHTTTCDLEEGVPMALQRAAELGRQQGWNEAIEAAVMDAGGYVAWTDDQDLNRGLTARIRSLKIPTQQKAEG